MNSILIDSIILFTSLVIILVSSELFTNGIEWLGQKLGLSEGVIGSVLAAVGTALPETLIPIVAVCSSHSLDFHEIGIGAIAGAPFMLTTLTLSVYGLAVCFYSWTKKRSMELKISTAVISRDLSFFIFSYGLALLASFCLKEIMAKQILAFLLLLVYGIYLKKTFAHEGEIGEAPEHLHFEKLLKLERNNFLIILQAIIGLLGILWGASVFVSHVHSLAHSLDVPATILSLIIAPIATELPEKCNSVIWAKNNKDTLALGNITGALVFQSCIPVAFGLAFTSWHLGPATILTGIIAIIFATSTLILVKTQKITSKKLCFGAIAYFSVVTWLIYTHLID